MDVAVEGIAQSPFVPVTAKVTVSPALMGVALPPIVESARVSTRRHGTMETNELAALPPANAA
jgi:hypothetical protein